ncbi:MAG: thioesterase, partial [Proteobacteria bacterium]|nr:thioesterase [Pseudomonadota bacterium]
MMLKMDAIALHGFLETAFPQVQGDFVIADLSADRISVQMPVADRHLRPGGTVSGPAMFALADVTAYL